MKQNEAIECMNESLRFLVCFCLFLTNLVIFIIIFYSVCDLKFVMLKKKNGQPIDKNLGTQNQEIFAQNVDNFLNNEEIENEENYRFTCFGTKKKWDSKTTKAVWLMVDNPNSSFRGEIVFVFSRVNVGDHRIAIQFMIWMMQKKGDLELIHFI